MVAQQKQYGKEHYEQIKMYKDVQGAQQAMENRIRRLAFEQERAQKLTEIATSKAENLLQARERHQRHVEEKMRLAEQRRAAEESARQRNTSDRLAVIAKRDAHIAMQRAGNQNARQQIQTNERMGYKRRVLERQQDIEAKRNGTENVQYNQRAFLNYKAAHRANHESRLQEEYQAKEAARQKAMLDMQDKVSTNDCVTLSALQIKQLENVESYMVQELGQTQKN